MIRSVKDLVVYQHSKDLYARIVVLTKEIPRDGLYLSQQIARSANSIHANIAEGFGRSKAEFCNYLTRALGSANETISHLEDVEIARYAHTTELQKEYDALGKQIYRLREQWKKPR
jgi:four helix bundle protein